MYAVASLPAQERSMAHPNRHTPHSASTEPRHTPGGTVDRNGRRVVGRLRLRAHLLSQRRTDGPENSLADWVRATGEPAAAHGAQR